MVATLNLRNLIRKTEAYRSGHNGHDWKSCSLNGLGGSNPPASARRKKYEPLRFVFLAFSYFFLKFERVGRRLATNDFILRTRKIKSPAGKETFLSPQGLIVNKITVIRSIRRFLIFQKYNAVCRGSSCRTRSLRSGNNKYKPCNACNFCPIRVFRRLIGYY